MVELYHLFCCHTPDFPLDSYAYSRCMLGSLLRWSINVWVNITGRTRNYRDFPWLYGPISRHAVVGSEYYALFARQENLETVSASDAGLVDAFISTIDDTDPHKSRLNPRISHFYEHTKQYKLDVWSQWYRPLRFFAFVLIRGVSRDMNQLNIPLEPLETSRGMSSDVLQLRDVEGKLQYACWLRQSILSGKVVYAGFYSHIEHENRKYVRVIFPLPGGNATVVLSVHVQEDGSVKLLSDGQSGGIGGYYRVRRKNDHSVKVKHIPLTESIHVFEDAEGTLRTDHIFWFLGIKMLHLHYKIVPVRASGK